VPRLQAERRLRIHAPGSSATDPARRLSCAEYARVYQQSRLSVVLTKDRVRQLKGRIFEVPLCGALLLCDANPYVDRFFTPFREYVPFADYEQLIDACRHYLAHEDERRAIAAAGSRKANRCYTARVFWDALFARVLPPETGDPS
jgi:spore maturation protein CgeB